ncbi:glutaredoxin family protein [Candidatus Odyssella thessalonicensis]|uniref:glutaredoxin family protein n=1 Tax=Candidatus Odyssella thessalonicensis TaxID=84647 RepID=UPI000225A901|nr:glutaredoxin domain-containing protein [Candidatus Odyssella thessalonicensis]
MKKFMLSFLIMSTAVLADQKQPSQSKNLIKQAVEKKQPEVIVYSSDQCSWCTSAKEILQERKIAYKEINVRGNKKLIDEMEHVTGKRTVPQIVINGKHIGSYLSLASANLSGELDEMLGNSQDKE